MQVTDSGDVNYRIGIIPVNDTNVSIHSVIAVSPDDTIESVLHKFEIG